MVRNFLPLFGNSWYTIYCIRLQINKTGMYVWGLIRGRGVIWDRGLIEDLQKLWRRYQTNNNHDKKRKTSKHEKVGLGKLFKVSIHIHPMLSIANGWQEWVSEPK